MLIQNLLLENQCTTELAKPKCCVMASLGIDYKLQEPGGVTSGFHLGIVHIYRKNSIEIFPRTQWRNLLYIINMQIDISMISNVYMYLCNVDSSLYKVMS